MANWTRNATYTVDGPEVRRTRQTQITARRILSDRTIERRLRDADPSAHLERAEWMRDERAEAARVWEALRAD